MRKARDGKGRCRVSASPYEMFSRVELILRKLPQHLWSQVSCDTNWFCHATKVRPVFIKKSIRVKRSRSNQFGDSRTHNEARVILTSVFVGHFFAQLAGDVIGLDHVQVKLDAFVLPNFHHHRTDGQIAKLSRHIFVPVGSVNELDRFPLVKLKSADDHVSEGGERHVDASQRREVLDGRGRVLVAEVVREPAGRDDGQIPLGREARHGRERVVARRAEEDVHVPVHVEVERRQRAPFPTTLGIRILHNQVVIGKQNSSLHFLNCDFDRRSTFGDGKHERCVVWEDRCDGDVSRLLLFG